VACDGDTTLGLKSEKRARKTIEKKRMLISSENGSIF
jgi:hypothetical protein